MTTWRACLQTKGRLCPGSDTNENRCRLLRNTEPDTAGTEVLITPWISAPRCRKRFLTTQVEPHLTNLPFQSVGLMSGDTIHATNSTASVTVSARVDGKLIRVSITPSHHVLSALKSNRHENENRTNQNHDGHQVPEQDRTRFTIDGRAKAA